MIFETSQDTIDFSVLEKVYNRGKRKWAVKLSSGADSTLLLYMVMKYLSSKNWPDLELHTITITKVNINPYQKEFSEKIADKIENMTGVKIHNRHHFEIYSTVEDVKENDVADLTACVNKLVDEGTVDYIFAGITANPTVEDAPFLSEDDYYSRSPTGRDKADTKKKLFEYGSCTPFLNIDKRGIADLYKQLDILEELFPMTRSCEAVTTDFKHHCGVCWFCKEREYGFGRLE